MAKTKSRANAAAGTPPLTVRAYPADGSVLLAFDLDKKFTKNLAGFAIKRTDPGGKSAYLPNRLNFTTRVTTGTKPEDRIWTASNEAPFQKFRWVDFPSNVTNGKYSYQVSAMYFTSGGKLTEGASQTVQVTLTGDGQGKFGVSFTRGYLSSQAYATEFHNAPIRPTSKSIDYPTGAYATQYEWLGYHARKSIFEFLNNCLSDQTCTVDCFAFDLDEPDFVRGLVKLGRRLRAFLDDAPLHTKPGALEPQALKLLQGSAGPGNVKTGHFSRFAHCKVLIKKDAAGKAVRVLTGSANFSVRGLYVQANNVVVITDEVAAQLYEDAFEQAFQDESKFATSEIADGWHELQEQDIPPFDVAFSPHTSASVSLDRVSEAIKGAKSSVLFAVMELGGGGSVLDQLRNLPGRNIFSYGMTQTTSGLKVYKPGEANGLIVPFAYLKGKVPAPFQAEFSGGIGQVIHHKFVVVDFNDKNPVVFCGSSNLAAGGEQSNGDNLLAIYDSGVAYKYAVEAVRLVDHYHFRAAMQDSTDTQPLTLKRGGGDQEWWEPYYDSKNIKYRDRVIFVQPSLQQSGKG